MLLSGVGTGAIIAGAIALYDRLQLHMDRAFSDIMPIQSGNISLPGTGLPLCSGLVLPQESLSLEQFLRHSHPVRHNGQPVIRLTRRLDLVSIAAGDLVPKSSGTGSPGVSSWVE